MTKIILFILITITSILGQEELENPFLGNDNFPMGYSLVANSMPNFMHLYMKDGGMYKVDLSAEQEKAIEEVFASRPAKVMQKAMEIKELETQLALAVVDNGKSAKDMEDVLNSIAQKKKEMTILQIECMSVFKKVLTKEQYKVLRDMAIEKAEDL